MRHQNPRLRSILWWIIGLSLSLHLVALVLGHTAFVHWRWIHLPVHAAVEMSGSVIALMVVWFLHSLHQLGQGTSYNMVIASALGTMGILDGMHALENQGNAFVWLHSTATAVGGTFFVLIWLPHDIQSRLNERWLLTVMLATFAFGSVSMIWRDWVPAMVEDGQFTFVARALNMGGGILMLTAAVRLFLTYRDRSNTDDLLFCLHCTLFGAAAIMFEQSVLWDLPWWGWHGLRLLAYMVALWFILLADHRAQNAIKASRVELKQTALSLEERVEERTEILRRREAESRTIIEASPNGMIIVNREGKIVRLNEAAASMFGYKPNELVGMPIELLVPDELRTRHSELREGYYRETESRRMAAGRDLEGRRKDGSTIPVEIGLNPIETTDGAQVLASVVDLTERIRADKELQLSANRLKLATKAGGIGVWDYDIVNNVLVWDEDMYRIYGIPRERFSGAYEAWEGGLHPDDKEAEAEKLQRAIRGEEDFNTEFRIIWHQDGSIHFIRAHGTVIRDESGAAIRMIGVNWDNTERREYEEKLRAAKLDAEAAAQAKSEFLANMSHEIRTPMNGIMGMTELLLGSKLEREQREYLNLISHSAESLLTIINDILDFSKIEAGKLYLDPYEFDLRDSIGDTLQTLGLRAEEKQLELAYQVQSNVPDRLLGDLGRIRQVLVNLVGNAIKFTEEGEVVVDIRLDSRTREHVSLHILVRDTGIGISAEKQATIFEAFTQAEGSTTRIYGGTGLGLTVSKKLVDLMKGRLWVESQPGTGSTFHFTVLVKIGSEGSEIVRSAPETLNGLRVLVVDDNETSRKILEEILHSWEMAPRCASNGPDALAGMAAAAKSDQPFQLVLLDEMMPEMDGKEVARRIKEAHGESAPGIMVLASSHTIDSEEISRLGIVRILTKPVKQSDLLDAITRLFGSATRDEKGGERATTVRPERIRPMRVLLAEDGRVNQIVAMNLLEERGHSVAVANDGQAAVEMYERASFDAILMDVQMPTLDGYAATARIRDVEKKTARHIPIIAMTANAMKGDREKCIEAGMDDYVAKPVRSAELFAILEKYAADSTAADGAADENDNNEVTGDSTPIPPGGGEDIEVFDREGFRDELAHSDLMRQLIDLFHREANESLEQARKAIAARNKAELHEAAHSLKGLVGNYKAKKAFRVAAELDELARSSCDLSGAAKILGDCEREVGHLNAQLQKFRDTLG